MAEPDRPTHPALAFPEYTETATYSTMSTFSSGTSNTEEEAGTTTTTITPNYFPTRSNFRRVDQRVNLMDLEAATYEEFPDEPSDSSYNYDDDDANHSGSDIFAIGTPRHKFRPPRKGSIQQIAKGLQKLRRGLPMVRANSLPDLHEHSPSQRKSHSMSFMTMDDSSSSSNNSISNGSGSTEFRKAAFEFEQGMRSTQSQRRAEVWKQRGTIVLGIALFLFVAYLVGSGVDIWLRQSRVSDSSSEMAVLEVRAKDMVVTTRQGSSITSETTETKIPSTTEGAIARRKLVLEHVIQVALLPELGKTKSDHQLDLTHLAAQKALQWMTGYDSESMRMLDRYRFTHGKTHSGGGLRRNLHQPSVSSFGAHVSHHVQLRNRDDSGVILERYILATGYFAAHSSASVETTTSQDVKR